MQGKLHAGIPAAAAAALIVALAGVAGACSRRPEPHPATRIVPSTAPRPAPGAVVAAPKPLNPSQFPLPQRWTETEDKPLPLVFGFDLDLIAPLGNGPANAALYFRDFAGNDGSRAVAWEEATTRKVTRRVAGRERGVLPPDDPLLLEAEPWIDQARMRFYPDVWTDARLAPASPNLLQIIRLADSWVARSSTGADPEAAREDCRRAIRVGRLLLQDDVTSTQNLVGVACVRTGAECLYEIARREGDTAGLLVAQRALYDALGLRARIDGRLRTLEVFRSVERRWWAPWRRVLRLSESKVEAVIRMARSDPSRALRIEAQPPLAGIALLGSSDQRASARSALDELAKDPDPLVASSAVALREAVAKGMDDASAFACLGGT